MQQVPFQLLPFTLRINLPAKRVTVAYALCAAPVPSGVHEFCSLNTLGRSSNVLAFSGQAIKCVEGLCCLTSAAVVVYTYHFLSFVMHHYNYRVSVWIFSSGTQYDGNIWYELLGSIRFINGNPAVNLQKSMLRLPSNC